MYVRENIQGTFHFIILHTLLESYLSMFSEPSETSKY